MRYAPSQLAPRALALPILVLFVLLGSGCQYPRPTHTYEYLNSYERMNDGSDPTVSLVYVPEVTAFRHYRGLIIGEVAVGEDWVQTPQKAAGFATFFRVVLRSKLAKLGLFDYVSLERAIADRRPAPGDALLLEGKITRFDMGSGFLRYLTYFTLFFQAGATDLQIEGRITEADTGKLVMEFVDRRRHLANTPFGPNPRNFEDGFAMKVTATETAGCLARFIELGRAGFGPIDASTPVEKMPRPQAEEGA